jgi:hypothetical protein
MGHSDGHIHEKPNSALKGDSATIPNSSDENISMSIQKVM